MDDAIARLIINNAIPVKKKSVPKTVSTIDIGDTIS